MEEKNNVFKIAPMKADPVSLPERKEGETLSEYLDGITSYINGISELYGAKEEPHKEVSDVVFAPREAEQPAVPEQPAPETVTVPVPEAAEEAAAEEAEEEVFFGQRSDPADDIYTEKYEDRQDSPLEEEQDAGGYDEEDEEYEEYAGEEDDDPYAGLGKLRRLFGDSRFSVVTCIGNIAAYVIWLIGYVVCIFERESYFASYEANMASKGITSYQITITTPFFAVLKAVLYLMPVVMILWTAAVVLLDKKGKAPVPKKSLGLIFGLDVAVGITAVIDAAYAGLLFT